jgi:type IV secretory pathway VirB2 component (pilin)
VRIVKKSGAVLLGLIFSKMAMASTQGEYPWDTFLKKIADNLSSNVALSIGICAVVGCGLAIAFGDLQGGAKKGVNVGIGLAIAFSAASIIGKLWSVSGTLIF